MGTYIKKDIRELMKKLDSKSLPRKWNEFIKKESKEHNLLIRNGNEYYCTYCEKSITGKPRIGAFQKCPYCKQVLVVRSKKLKYEYFIKELTLLDKVNGQLVIRLFELRSTYCYTKKCFVHSTVEYGRIVLNQNYTLLNNRISLFMSSINIKHYNNITHWRKYSGYSSFSSRGNLYPYNLKNILKNTIYQYSQLWTFIKKVKGCDLENLLTGVAKYPSFEFLIKMKLYNLALDADSFNEKGNFKDRFGIDKEYYNFIKKHNLCYEELEILQLLKLKNIKEIRYLRNKIGIYAARNISKYIDIKKILKYKRNKLDAYLYSDYIKFASELGMNLKDKNILFPKDLKAEHDKLSKRYKAVTDLKIKKKVIERYKELLKNKYKNDKYVVFPAQSVAALKDESKQQNHCVQGYAEEYANAECDIYFMRLIDNIKKSLVTIEVKDNKIVQKRIFDNERTNDEENKFLEEWQTKVLEKCRV